MDLPLSKQISEIADTLKKTDPRRPPLLAAVVQLKAWEMHIATRHAEQRGEPPPEPREVQCGLCGYEGRRYTTTCPECGGHW